ncbi:lytic murein transglycosylase B [Beggiatoa leptomitoformis]|uniref:Lytic murein transglycosylase B n=1 Tax=Beggiatoa leptomitoformis TaxID=288004 RepID=A0A2N9YFT1_9GAMM|nr:lytic murein transglycosylase B [Beggiatoa leptomitoformis]ALG68433.1 lytic murein transglycosylase B [Beggiatoa leptomitoformis]AUI69235.1 lytic murein transglycosylase B [Beggiatoa leptomitoformis]
MRFITNFLLPYGLLFALCVQSIATFASSQTEFITEMVNRHGFDYNYLSKLLAQTEVKQSILKAITPPKSGKARPWYVYRKIFINDDRINGGVAFWRENAVALRYAEQTYGVPAEFLVAIIGVETNYGQNMGSYRILDALTTLAFNYPRRADYFRGELEDYLLFTREEHIDPLSLKGSYAGAMGLGQFMPSSFREFAVDFDNDGHRNIWSNPTDAVGSVANYFKQHGWQSKQPVMIATQVRPDAVKNLVALDFKPNYSLGWLKQNGLLFYGNLPDQTQGLVIDLETEQGMAYWFGLNNFYVITRYNHSSRYAMAVYQLATEIATLYYGQIQ